MSRAYGKVVDIMNTENRPPFPPEDAGATKAEAGGVGKQSPVDSRLDDILDAAVEKDELPFEETPSLPEKETADRAVILGQDGRWIAGWALRFIIMAAALVILWKALGTVWSGLLPVVLALIVSTVLWPPVRWLRQRKVPPALAVVITIVGAIAVIGGIFASIAPSIANQSKDLVDKASQGIGQLRNWAETGPLNLDLSKYDDLIQKGINFLQDQMSNIASGVVGGVTAASEVLVTVVLMLILSFFFLKDGDRFLPMVRTTTGPNVGWHLTEVLTRMWNTLSGYVRAQATVSLVDAVLIGLGLIILKVPLALALGVITFFAGFIPIVGAFSAGALAVIIALVSNGIQSALFVLILIVAVQQIEGHVLQPVLQSKAMNLHAAIVLLAVTLGSTLFGVIGAFLAVPVAATLAVLVRYHAELVALRAGEITIDDIEMATTAEAQPSVTTQEAWTRFRESLSVLGNKKSAEGDSDEASTPSVKIVAEEEPKQY